MEGISLWQTSVSSPPSNSGAGADLIDASEDSLAWDPEMLPEIFLKTPPRRTGQQSLARSTPASSRFEFATEKAIAIALLEGGDSVATIRATHANNALPTNASLSPASVAALSSSSTSSLHRQQKQFESEIGTPGEGKTRSHTEAHCNFREMTPFDCGELDHQHHSPPAVSSLYSFDTMAFQEKNIQDAISNTNSSLLHSTAESNGNARKPFISQHVGNALMPVSLPLPQPPPPPPPMPMQTPTLSLPMSSFNMNESYSHIGPLDRPSSPPLSPPLPSCSLTVPPPLSATRVPSSAVFVKNLIKGTGAEELRHIFSVFLEPEHDDDKIMVAGHFSRGFAFCDLGSREAVARAVNQSRTSEGIVDCTGRRLRVEPSKKPVRPSGLRALNERHMNTGYSGGYHNSRKNRAHKVRQRK